MARFGVTILPSSNDASRRVRCGINEQTIEKDERTIYVATSSRGRECKPEALLQTVVRVIRRGEQEKGWEPIDMAAAMGLEVRLIKVADKSLVMLGENEIYLEDKGGVEGRNWLSPASEVAGAIAAALGTTVRVVVSKTFSAFVPKDDTRE